MIMISVKVSPLCDICYPLDIFPIKIVFSMPHVTILCCSSKPKVFLNNARLRFRVCKFSKIL